MRRWTGIVPLGFLIALWLSPSNTCRHEYTAIFVYYNNDCGLTEIPTDIPSETYQVWLVRNKIANIKAGAISHLADCTFMVLDSNKLSVIRADMWDGLQSLKELHLFQNLISYIEPGSFAKLLNLHGLYMESNQLTTLEKDIFNSLIPSHLVLAINHNPLNCDSRMCWIKQGEEDGTIALFHQARGITWRKPSCENYPGFEWDDVTINCPTTGHNGIRDVSTMNLDNHEISTSYPDNQGALTNNLTVKVKSSTQNDNQDVPIYYILGGVAGGVIFICLLACIAVIIFKRTHSSTPTSDERATQENRHYTKLLRTKDAPSAPYPDHYVTQHPRNDPRDSDYEVPISHQDQADEHSLYEDVDDPEEIYEDVRQTET